MTFKGFLKTDEFGCLKCGDNYLISAIDKNFKIDEKVFVSYYITEEMVSEEEAKQALIINTVGGNIEELDFILYAYSENTIMLYNEELIIEEHDLFEELSSSIGKYLILQINHVD